MHAWLDELADTLGVERISADDAGALLRLTRDVAHGVERRFAPLAAYLVGAAVGAARSAEGGAAAFADALARARSVTPEPRPSPDGPEGPGRPGPPGG
ncbi:MAG TPA: DUF6457 domain-containing protein [Actinomycetota bacterium]